MELVLHNTNRISSFKDISNRFDYIQIYLHSEHTHYQVYNDFSLLTKLVISLSTSIFKS